MPFLPFVYGYPSSSPCAHCTHNKSVSTLRYTLVECCFTSTETVSLLGTGAQDGHVDFHTAPELCDTLVGTYRVQSPGFPKIVYSHLATWIINRYRCSVCTDESQFQNIEGSALSPSYCLTSSVRSDPHVVLLDSWNAQRFES